MDKLGKLIAEARETRDVSIEKLAKEIDCSENYARHLQSNPRTIVSDRLRENLAIVLGIPKTKLEEAIEARNKVGKAFYAKYRAERAEKAAKSKKKKGA